MQSLQITDIYLILVWINGDPEDATLLSILCQYTWDIDFQTGFGGSVGFAHAYATNAVQDVLRQFFVSIAWCLRHQSTPVLSENRGNRISMILNTNTISTPLTVHCSILGRLCANVPLATTPIDGHHYFQSLEQCESETYSANNPKSLT
jgi:hypothetical protein